MRLKTRSILLLVLVLLVPVLGACGSDDDPAVDDGAATTEAPTEENKVALTGADYSFDGPAEMKGGLVTIEFTNTGKEPHQAQLTKLDAGKTVSDVAAALKTEGPEPDWMHAQGGPMVGAGATTTYTANVAEGDYALLCLIPGGPEGKPHAALGMIAPLKVTAGDEGDLPEADVTVSAKDFEFLGTENLKAGKQTVKVDNQGPSEHEWALAELQPGKTAKDLMSESQGPPPIAALPGIAAPMQSGSSAVATVELKAGVTYAMACFVFDPKAEAPHAAIGMLKEFKVT